MRDRTVLPSVQVGQPVAGEVGLSRGICQWLEARPSPRTRYRRRRSCRRRGGNPGATTMQTSLNPTCEDPFGRQQVMDDRRYRLLHLRSHRVSGLLERPCPSIQGRLSAGTCSRFRSGPSTSTAYLVSFLVIGIIWISRHAMCALARRVDRLTLWPSPVTRAPGRQLDQHSHVWTR